MMKMFALYVSSPFVLERKWHGRRLGIANTYTTTNVFCHGLSWVMNSAQSVEKNFGIGIGLRVWHSAAEEDYHYKWDREDFVCYMVWFPLQKLLQIISIHAMRWFITG